MRAVLASHETVTLTSFANNVLEFVGPRAFAPGAPIRLTTDGEAQLTLEGRALQSSRQPDGQFRVRARMVSLRRPERERLEAWFPVRA